MRARPQSFVLQPCPRSGTESPQMCKDRGLSDRGTSACQATVSPFSGCGSPGSNGHSRPRLTRQSSRTPAPLSLAQQEVLTKAHNAPVLAVRNPVLVLQRTGELEKEALRRSLD